MVASISANIHGKAILASSLIFVICEVFAKRKASSACTDEQLFETDDDAETKEPQSNSRLQMRDQDIWSMSEFAKWTEANTQTSSLTKSASFLAKLEPKFI